MNMNIKDYINVAVAREGAAEVAGGEGGDLVARAQGAQRAVEVGQRVAQPLRNARLRIHRRIDRPARSRDHGHLLQLRHAR
jgi:hypothetical protein